MARIVIICRLLLNGRQLFQYLIEVVIIRKENDMKNLMKLLFFLLFAFGLIIGCSDDSPLIPPAPAEGNTTEKLNKFIKDAMTEFYLWEDKMPGLDYKTESDSKAYFDKLLYKEEDRWSWITDDVDALLNSFEGKEKSFGWVIGTGEFSNTGTLYAFVVYVNPGTPAANAGIKRGDFIVKINNGDITDDNVDDLFSADQVNISMGIDTESGITVGESLSLTAEELELNPVVKTNIVEYNNHKIGYIFYTQFITDYNFALDTALESMIENQVTELVIDLRYNGGGYLAAATHLCSSLAPLTNVNGENRLITKRWNQKLQKYYVDNQIMHQIEQNFDKTVPVKMGLDKIHFLVGSNTASASELTITGLSPYMQVTMVGDTTHGKYTASVTLTPDIFYDSDSYYESFEKWALQPIVFRYANSFGQTDFKDGFAPDILAQDDYSTALGTIEEPLFNAAIEDISGDPAIAMKSAKKMRRPFVIHEIRSSRYDKYKNKLLIDNFDPERLK